MITESLQVAEDKGCIESRSGKSVSVSIPKQLAHKRLSAPGGGVFQVMQYWPPFLSFQLEDLADIEIAIQSYLR
jgi:hypothetical protein